MYKLHYTNKLFSYFEHILCNPPAEGYCAIENYILFIFTIITFQTAESQRLNQYKIILGPDVHDILNNSKTTI